MKIKEAYVGFEDTDDVGLYIDRDDDNWRYHVNEHQGDDGLVQVHVEGGFGTFSGAIQAAIRWVDQNLQTS